MDWYISVLKKYAVFDGRARRKEYWMFTLFNFIISLVLSFFDALFGTSIELNEFGLFSGIYALGVLLPGIGVMIRRLHDVGKSGWFFWINLIPIIGWIWFFILLVTDSNPGSNKYGPNPKGNDFSNTYQGFSNQQSEIRYSTVDIPGEIKKLADLKDSGIITDEEFTLKKQELLSKM